MKHETLFLNSKRTYVLVNDTWYDTSKEINPQVGQPFLTGKVEKVLTYEEYKEEYPDAKQEIYPSVTDKTVSGGFLRRTVDGLVKYAINPATPTQNSKVESSLD